MTVRGPWVFGDEPLDQQLDVAPLLRRVAGLVLAVEAPDPAVARLVDDLRAAEAALLAVVPPDLRPRVGPDLTPDQRCYIDHGHDVGRFNPVFPEYAIVVDGPERATGTVTFPLVFEGPPGIVHGGVLATFVDAVVQHHNCLVGQAGKTITLSLRYRRPTFVDTPLRFEIDRVLGERITAEVRLYHPGAAPGGADELLVIGTMDAVAGVRTNLPATSPRRAAP